MENIRIEDFKNIIKRDDYGYHIFDGYLIHYFDDNKNYEATKININK